MEFQLKKGYRPYEAYQYLEPGRDFKVIDWADWDWAGRNILPLDPEEEIRCRELLERTPYVSLHDHPDFTTRDMSTCEPLFDAMRTGRDRCGYEALAYSCLLYTSAGRSPHPHRRGRGAAPQGLHRRQRHRLPHR